MIATRSILNLRKPAKGCPFCLQNGMIPHEKVVTWTPWAYLVREYSQVIPGTYQIVPKWHKMNPVKWVLFALSLLWLAHKAPASRGDFNISVNFGEGAGQTNRHPHTWIIPRVDDYAGKGLAHYVSTEARCRRETGMTLKGLVDEHVTSQH